MKAVRSFGRQEPKIRRGSLLVIACMVMSLCAIQLLKARYCASPSVGEISLGMVVDREEDQVASPPLEDDEDDGKLAGDETKPVCDTSGKRSDTCEVKGDVRVDGNSSTIFFLQSSSSSSSSRRPAEEQQGEWRIRPYARKGSIAQAHVREWTIKSLSAAGDHRGPPLPACTQIHHTPAVVFSVGGFTGNLFHDFTDVLIPLFISSRQFRGDVRFLVADTKPWWVERFLPVLKLLSRHPVVDMDADDRNGGVHCFPRVIAGPTFHKELGVHARLTPGGYSMDDFREMLAQGLGLRRRTAGGGGGARPPRLLIISRKTSRLLLNEREVGEMARSLGFEVVVGQPELAAGSTGVAKFAKLVNTADVMAGVHGAGLTNMVFLPAGGVVVQVIPLGGLEWVARDSFRGPAEGMGLRYLEYRIQADESSLAEQYPADHPVLRDPSSVHNQGWDAIKSVYLDNQNIRPHLGRLRETLLEALQLLPSHRRRR